MDQLIARGRGQPLGRTDRGRAARRAAPRPRRTSWSGSGVRELELGLDTEVGRELSRLADAASTPRSRFTIASCARATARRATSMTTASSATRTLAVIGMGKLGGEELNFASDVDVIYVYSSDQGEAGALSLHEYFAKLCTQVTARAVRGHRGRRRVSRRSAAAPRGRQGRDRELARSDRALLRDVRPAVGAPGVDQGARCAPAIRALGAETIAMLRAVRVPALHVARRSIDDVRELNRRIKRELVAEPAASTRLRSQERRRRHPRDRVLRAGAAADPRAASGRACARAARSPRSMRCCSRASSPTTSTSRCGARTAGCATPSTCCSSKAACRRRPFPTTPTRRTLFARRLGYADRRRARARCCVAHTSAVVAAVRDARRSSATSDRPTSTRSCAASSTEDAEAAALDAARLSRRHRGTRRARARAPASRLAAVARRDRARRRGSARRCSPRSRHRPIRIRRCARSAI